MERLRSELEGNDSVAPLLVVVGTPAHTRCFCQAHTCELFGLFSADVCFLSCHNNGFHSRRNDSDLHRPLTSARAPFPCQGAPKSGARLLEQLLVAQAMKYMGGRVGVLGPYGRLRVVIVLLCVLLVIGGHDSWPNEVGMHLTR